MRRYEARRAQCRSRQCTSRGRSVTRRRRRRAAWMRRAAGERRMHGGLRSVAAGDQERRRALCDRGTRRHSMSSARMPLHARRAWRWHACTPPVQASSTTLRPRIRIQPVTRHRRRPFGLGGPSPHQVSAPGSSVASVRSSASSRPAGSGSGTRDPGQRRDPVVENWPTMRQRVGADALAQRRRFGQAPRSVA